MVFILGLVLFHMPQNEAIVEPMHPSIAVLAKIGVEYLCINVLSIN